MSQTQNTKASATVIPPALHSREAINQIKSKEEAEVHFLLILVSMKEDVEI